MILSKSEGLGSSSTVVVCSPLGALAQEMGGPILETATALAGIADLPPIKTITETSGSTFGKALHTRTYGNPPISFMAVGDSGNNRIKIYRRDQSTPGWTLFQTITAPSGAAGFGASVALGVGLLFVGAPATSGGNGVVFVYEQPRVDYYREPDTTRSFTLISPTITGENGFGTTIVSPTRSMKAGWNPTSGWEESGLIVCGNSGTYCRDFEVDLEAHISELNNTSNNVKRPAVSASGSIIVSHAGGSNPITAYAFGLTGYYISGIARQRPAGAGRSHGNGPSTTPRPRTRCRSSRTALVSTSANEGVTSTTTERP